LNALRPILRFFLDHNVPESAARTFEDAGHEVRRLRRVLPIDAPDDLVAATAIVAGEILVSHDRDFKAMSKRLGLTNSSRTRLSLIKLSCPEPTSAARLLAAMSLIEHEWDYCQQHGSRMLRMEISAKVIRSER
jgi:predicted nuclease of predicted toxin-antitoxin system